MRIYAVQFQQYNLRKNTAVASSYNIGYMLLNKFCIIAIQKISVVAVTALLLQNMSFAATLYYT